jgi:hypothetical protein
MLTGMLTPERLDVLQKTFDKASKTCLSALNWTLPCIIFMGDNTRKKRNMSVERHNFARRMIMKAIRKIGSLEFCFVCMDTGSNQQLAMQVPQLFLTAEPRRVVPKWLFLKQQQVYLQPSRCCAGRSHLRKT